MRQNWVDAARGLAIVLVVVGHDLRGLQAPGLVPDHVFAAIDPRIYAFHMPLFFVLSGLFLDRTLSRNAGEFLTGRLIRLLWPLVLWTYLFAALRVVAGDAANSAGDGLWVLPFPGRDHLWFLWALLLCHLALYPIWPWVRRAPLALAALVVAGWALPWPPGLWLWVGQALLYLPWLLLGSALGPVLPKVPEGWGWSALAIFALCLALVPLWPVGLYPAAVLALVLTLAFLLSLRQFGPAWPVLPALGQATMAIYLAHTAFSAALRILLLRLGVTEWAVHLILGTVIGILGPLALLWVARRLRAERILGF